MLWRRVPMMRAAVLKHHQAIAKRPLEVGEVVWPKRGAGQVLLEVRACGVCRTDLHIVEGELEAQKRPVIPGHQIVGEIVDGATPELPLGTRAGVSWLGGVDGTCPLCRRGM